MKAEAGRFLLAGAANTAATYLIYLMLLPVLGYVAAYSTCYVAGILFSYALNTVFVFRTAPTARSVLLFPLVYVVQYLVGLGVLDGSIRYLGVPRPAALAVSIAVTIPLTFILARAVLTNRKDDAVAASEQRPRQ